MFVRIISPSYNKDCPYKRIFIYLESTNNNKKTMQTVVDFVAGSFGISAAFAAIALIIFSVWSLFWKGWALWKAARLSQRNWFIVLLVVNTLGILEIIYIFFVAKKKEARQNN
jgi:hypothetical protein